MSGETSVSFLLSKHEVYFDLIYKKISSKETLSKYIEFNKEPFFLELNSDLKKIEFGSLSFRHKLQYLFIQYIIKEVGLFSDKNFTLFSNYRINKGLKNIIFPKFFWNFLLDNKIKKESYQKLETNLKNYLNDLSNLNLSQIQIDAFTSKSLFLFVISLIDLLVEIDKKLGENLTQYEKKNVTKLINSIINVVEGFEAELLRNSTRIKHQLPIYSSDFFENLIKINRFDLNFEKILEIVNKVKIKSETELNRIIDLNFPKKSINYLYNHFNDQKILTTDTRKKIIQDQIKNNQQILKEKLLFDKVSTYPLNIHETEVLIGGWKPFLTTERITKNEVTKGIRLHLIKTKNMDTKKRYENITEWKLKFWVFSELIPGGYFIRKSLSELPKSDSLKVREEFGLHRWIYLIFAIFVRNGYFDDPNSRFMSLWELYYHFNLLSGIFEFLEGKNLMEICIKIQNSTGIDITSCSNDFYSYYSNLYKRLILTIDSLYLLHIQNIFIQDSLPMQRFVDIIIKNLNFPLEILEQIFEKSFKIVIKNISIKNLTNLFNS
jgi:hypothetical protein